MPQWSRAEARIVAVPACGTPHPLAAPPIHFTHSGLTHHHYLCPTCDSTREHAKLRPNEWTRMHVCTIAHVHAFGHALHTASH
mmetsp:Transcript_40809/g.81844  ORF Transcript_40809/g.81844 Transcript_40809/m.81844 type:complete len:83 (-) Transcript_40809:523-771(-)